MKIPPDAAQLKDFGFNCQNGTVVYIHNTDEDKPLELNSMKDHMQNLGTKAYKNAIFVDYYETVRVF